MPWVLSFHRQSRTHAGSVSQGPELPPSLPFTPTYCSAWWRAGLRAGLDVFKRIALMFSICAACNGLVTACLPLWLGCMVFLIVWRKTHSALLQRTLNSSQNGQLGCDFSCIAWVESLQADWMEEHRSTYGADTLSRHLPQAVNSMSSAWIWSSELA